MLNILNGRLFCATLGLLLLTIIPLPYIFTGLRPPFLCLLVLYVQFFLPQHFNLIGLLFLGLILDALLSTLIGQHVFALTIACCVASTKARRFKFFTMGQQMGLIAILCFIYQLANTAVDLLLGYPVKMVPVSLSIILSMLLWPWMRYLGDQFFIRIKKPRFINDGYRA